MIRVAIASDHAGFSLKAAVKDWLISNCYVVYDYGCHNNEIVDYPDYVGEVVHDVIDETTDYGILICGSGVGVSIAANRHPNIRAALCYTSDIARLAREHNDANIVCLGAVFITIQSAQEILKTFFQASFTNGRHKVRIKKIESQSGIN